MKMEGAGDAVLNGRTSEVSKPAQPSPKEIGREFVRQYYTMLSEKPQDVFRFYSHESFFVHGTEPPVQGQQKIQKAIENLAFVDCKARIYTVNGTATMNNGLVIQVCGELSIRNNPPRRFIQTFILCPQTPKKYYVHNDVFQWLDRAFGDTLNQAQEAPEIRETSPPSTDNNTVSSNGDISLVNGHSQTLSDSNEITEPSLDSSPEDTGKTNPEKATLMNEHDDVADKKSQIDQVPVENPEQPVVTESNKAPEQNLAVDTEPKTWAKMVGSSSTYSKPLLQQLSQSQHAIPPMTRQSLSNTQSSNSISSQSTNNVNSNNDNGYHLFVGGITRKLMPDNVGVIEKEIRAAFEKYGPVKAVKVPRRALDANDPHRNVYAFIEMKTTEGARNAFNATRKDRALSLIHLKIDSVGFDGEACLSEPRSGQMVLRQPFSHRGPPFQGALRGAFAMRAGVGVGRGPNGGTRGIHSRQYNGGNDFRNVAEHDRH